jgi:hypothetical protein
MRKGRNRALVSKRNKALLERYYYWTNEKRVRFDDVLGKLSEEFFLSEDRIVDILRKEGKEGKE